MKRLTRKVLGLCQLDQLSHPQGVQPEDQQSDQQEQEDRVVEQLHVARIGDQQLEEQQEDLQWSLNTMRKTLSIQNMKDMTLITIMTIMKNGQKNLKSQQAQ